VTSTDCYMYMFAMLNAFLRESGLRPFLICLNWWDFLAVRKNNYHNYICLHIWYTICGSCLVLVEGLILSRMHLTLQTYNILFKLYSYFISLILIDWLIVWCIVLTLSLFQLCRGVLVIQLYEDSKRMFYRYLSLLYFYFVCSSLIYRFWLPLWYLQTHLIIFNRKSDELKINLVWSCLHFSKPGVNSGTQEG
jgi:hypothetical protein